MFRTRRLIVVPIRYAAAARLEFHSALSVIIQTGPLHPGVFGITPRTWSANTFDPATDRIGSYLICECVVGCHSGDCLCYEGFGMWKKDQPDKAKFHIGNGISLDL